ncbi:MAG: hypothetical protein ABH874_03125 [Methanobacteriota archaeon]
MTKLICRAWRAQQGGEAESMSSSLARTSAGTAAEGKERGRVSEEAERFKIKQVFTGDPWIDAGVVALWDYIESQEIQNTEVEINRKNYAITAPSPDQIENFLKKIFEKIKNERYIQSAKNKVCIYNNEKDDFEIVPKINLVNVVNALFSGGDLKPKYQKCDFPKNKQGIWDNIRDSYEEQKDKIDFKIDDKGRIYCSRPQYNWPYQPNFNPERKEICTFCGSPFATSNIHSNNYPFLVPVKNWSNFYSNLSLDLKMCSLCEAASLFAINRIFFNINRRKKTLFMAIPHASSLDEIEEFWKDVRGIIEERRLSDSSNIFEGGYKYQYLNETILAFSYELCRSLKETVDASKRLNVASTKIWYFFLGSISGKSVSFKNNTVFDEMSRLFKLYESLENQGINFMSMFSNLVVKEGDNDYNNFYREAFSERIIKNAPLNEIAEKIMYKKGEKIMNFARFVKLYNIGRYS